MAHEITVRDNGFAEAMYTLTPAWHGLGQVVENAPTSADAMKLAGMMWEVEQHPVQTIVSRGGYDDDGHETIETDIVEIPDRLANVRSDNNTVLGIVGPGYKPVQNWEAFEFVDSLVQDGEIRYESAGTLKGGRIVWLLARMPEEIHATEQDVTKQYILFTNGHDGSKAVRVLPTTVRVVCNNTLNLALNRAGSALTIMHLGDVRRHLGEAREMLGLVRNQFESYERQVHQLVGHKMTYGTVQSYLEAVFPYAPDQNNDFRDKARMRIMELLGDGPQTMEGVRGTGWAAFNATTQYVDHEMTRIHGGRKTAEQKAEHRMASALFGRGASLKAHALSTALTMAEYNI